MIKITFLVLAIMSFHVAQAGRIRIPCRYVITTYTVHRLTGLTSNEKEKDKLLNASVGLVVTEKNGSKYIRFDVKPDGGIDVSDPESAFLCYDKIPDLITALSQYDALARDARWAKENIEKTVFPETDDVQCIFMSRNGGRSSIMELRLGTRMFALSKHHITSVINELKRM